uniref:Uncharacterized protein n=1 Tax=Tetranychus urticae TaxID=32264 RepID=T1L3Y7_TETUR
MMLMLIMMRERRPKKSRGRIREVLLY